MEFNARLKSSRFRAKIRDFTLISNASHQNRRRNRYVCDPVLIFSQIRDDSFYELNYMYTEVLHPKGFQNVLLISITIFTSSYLHFFFKYGLLEDLCHSQSRLFMTKYYVTKRKSLQCFDQRISRAFPSNLHKSKQFSVV